MLHSGKGIDFLWLLLQIDFESSGNNQDGEFCISLFLDGSVLNLIIPIGELFNIVLHRVKNHEINIVINDLMIVLVYFF